MKLNVKAFALAAGILWGISVAILVIMAMYTTVGAGLSTLIVTSYPGVSVSWGGAAIGAVIGFVDAGIGCAIFAWLYNKLA